MVPCSKHHHGGDAHSLENLMASKSKSIGRAIISAYGALPAEDDPRWMDIDSINAAVDEMEVDTSPTASTQPKSLAEIAPDIWARHNAKPGQKAEAASRSRPAKQPQTLDEISADAWNRFNNPGHGRTLGDR
jgi:cell division septation protein DedD